MTHRDVVSSSGVGSEDRLERSARAARATRATSRAHGPLLLRPTIKFTRSPLRKVTPFVSDTWKNTVLRGLTSVTLGALIKPNPGRRCVTVPKWRSSAISSSGVYDGATSARAWLSPSPQAPGCRCSCARSAPRTSARCGASAQNIAIIQLYEYVQVLYTVRICMVDHGTRQREMYCTSTGRVARL